MKKQWIRFTPKLNCFRKETILTNYARTVGNGARFVCIIKNTNYVSKNKSFDSVRCSRDKRTQQRTYCMFMSHGPTHTVLHHTFIRPTHDCRDCMQDIHLNHPQYIDNVLIWYCYLVSGSVVRVCSGRRLFIFFR